MAEFVVTILVVLLVIAAMKIPALGDALGRLVRGPGRSAQPPSPPDGQR
jgi:Sec-independent protein translocase protein TatA